ncbi:25090_t:CDS:2 [Dentiscutata erythropus]|uniref:25090_t:CDS:1 n=1 Tax=Dentiscutata erythropus TaxID=1348616 RepID=A0A9N9IUR1_9GLOM|nr:25090_t:CDS:2 [Dentiscutata erythropus]
MASAIQPFSILTTCQSTINNCTEPEAYCTDNSLHEVESQLTPNSPKSGILPHLEYVSYDRVQDIYEQRKGHFYFIPEGFKSALVPNDSKDPAVLNLFGNSKPVPYDPNVPRMLPDSDARLSSFDLSCRVASSKKENSAIDKNANQPQIVHHQDISNDDISKEIGIWHKDSLKVRSNGDDNNDEAFMRLEHVRIAEKNTKNVSEEQLVNVVYALNGLENDFDGTSMLSSVILNPMQGHASIISSPSGYPQQPDNIDEFTLHCESYEEPNIPASQEASLFSYQTCINTEYAMQSNNLIDNATNNNTIFLYDNLFFNNNHMPSFHY